MEPNVPEQLLRKSLSIKRLNRYLDGNLLIGLIFKKNKKEESKVNVAFVLFMFIDFTNFFKNIS